MISELLDLFKTFHGDSSFASASIQSASVGTPYTPGVCMKTNEHHVISKNVDICDAYDTLNAALERELPTDRFGRSAIFGKGYMLHEMSRRISLLADCFSCARTPTELARCR